MFIVIVALIKYYYFSIIIYMASDKQKTINDIYIMTARGLGVELQLYKMLNRRIKVLRKKMWKNSLEKMLKRKGNHEARIVL